MMLDRKTPPIFSKEFSFKLSQPEVIPIDENLSIVWVNGIQQEVIKIEFVFNAGKWHEPKKGISYFTSHMLEKGTTQLSSLKIAEAFDHYGAQVEISSGADFSSVSLFVLVKNFDKVIPTLIDLLTDPSFPEGELDLMRSIFLETLRVNNEKNSFIASKVLLKNIFGSDHPYGKYVEEPDIKKISVSDLASFFKDFFTPIEIYLTGNLIHPQFSSLTNQLKKLPTKTKGSYSINSIPDQSPNKEILNKENSVQSAIRFGQKTLKKGHPDYPSLLLFNHILGGYFGSRLMKNIREEKGLTYGIYSSISSYLHGSIFSIATDTNKEKADLTSTEIIKEVELLLNNLVTSQELETAKNHFLGSIQLEVSNPFSVCEKIKNIRLGQLRDDYYENLFSEILNLTPKQLQSVAANQISPQNFHSVTVG